MAVDTELCLVPYPVKLVRLEGVLKIDISAGVSIESSSELSRVSQFLTQELFKRAGVQNLVQNSDGQCRITLEWNSDLGAVEGAYRLSINGNGIAIRAASAAGAFYGVQTLLQLIPLTGRLREIPCVEICDYPRFKWRGMMLDCSRHFFSKESIYKFIDMMAFHKLNVFHWHLTDNQGWRFEVKAYPRLQEISAWRKETMFGHLSVEAGFNGIPHGGFYSQADCRDVVTYAAERFIMVVPEIEMPGHSDAALAAYPEFGCTEEKLDVSCRWGIHKHLFNAGKENVFHFFETVLSEVADIFPSQYIHIGGDECPKDEWKSNPLCQQRMLTEGLKSEEELQSYFIRRIEKHINALGRTLIGWDEIIEGGLADNATVMSWRGIAGGVAAARARHNVIMSPNKSLYFNFYQENPLREPLAQGDNVLTLEKVYTYEPIPVELSAEESRHILGAQACIWTEYIQTFRHVQYMALPRTAALAEITWSPKEFRDFTSFKSRVDLLCLHYRSSGWLYRPYSG